MAPKVFPYNYLKQSAKMLPLGFREVSKALRSIVQPTKQSIEYQRWCERLIAQRFWLSVILAVVYTIVAGIAQFYEFFINPTKLIDDLTLLKSTYLLEPLRHFFFWHKVIIAVLISGVILFRNSAWGKRYPALLLVFFSWAISFIPNMVCGPIWGLPGYPDIIMFLAQAAILPVYWRLHFVTQLVPITFFMVIYPLIGMTFFAGRSVHSFFGFVQTVLICIICEVGVYLYEKSKQSELEANRRLKLCVHAITHDLRTPVIGSLMLLESMQKNTPVDQPIQIPQVEMSHLIQGYDRLLNLMNTLLDNQALAQGDLVLHQQPTDLNSVFATILQDFQPILLKKNIQINHQLCSELPLVNIDAQQIWRVLCNLVGNAVNHNPPGLLLTLDAVVVDSFADRSRSVSGKESSSATKVRGSKDSGLMLKVIVQDNGVGISPSQKDTIFEPYSRVQQSQYQPGLGLGLYICRQIVLAHGGEIGLDCLQPGARFWFTLPLQKAVLAENEMSPSIC
jgi:signal transduction histidine kinase